MSVDIHFDEILLDGRLFNLGFATGSPEFANSNIRSPISGFAKVEVLAYDPSILWSVDFADVDHDDAAAGVDYFLKIWYGGWGSAYGFRVRNEWDHKFDNEVLAVGDGIIKDFKLTKEYERPGTSDHPHSRRIIKPVVNTNLASSGSGPNPTFGSVSLCEPNGTTPRVIEIPFVVGVDGAPLADGAYTIKNTTGDLHINTAPAAGKVVSIISGCFDTPFQFWTNAFQMRADFPAEVRGLQMREIMPITLGIL